MKYDDGVPDDGFSREMTLRRIALTMIAVAAFFIALWIVLDFLVDWLWFSTLGNLRFLTTFAAKAGLFLVVFATSAFVLWLNGAPGASARQAQRKHAPGVPGD